MPIEPIVEMCEDGSFTAQARGAECHLIFDPASAGGRWLLLYRSQGAPEDLLLSMHDDLDEALAGLAAQADNDGGWFTIRLPDGNTFSRPGKVPAEEILATFGYMLIEGMTVYAVYESASELSDAEAERAVREMLTGYDVRIGSVDRIGDADPSWCLDMVLPFEGYIHRGALTAHAAGVLAGTALEVTGVIECQDVGAEVPDTSNVVHFPKAA